jgi:hypothetical protein
VTLTSQDLQRFRELAAAARFRTVDMPGLVQLTGDEVVALVEHAEQKAFDLVQTAIREAGITMLRVRPGYFAAYTDDRITFDGTSATSLRAVVEAMKTERKRT